MERLAYTVEEAAEVLGWSTDGIYDAVAAGHIARLPHTGRRVLIGGLALERFAAGLPPATPEELAELVKERARRRPPTSD